jgi:hypothetical protein
MEESKQNENSSSMVGQADTAVVEESRRAKVNWRWERRRTVVQTAKTARIAMRETQWARKRYGARRDV